MTSSQVLPEAMVRPSPGAFRMLIVVDDDGCARRIERALDGTSPDPSLRRVRTLAAARSALAERPCELALVAQTLPDGRGLDLLGTLREQEIDIPFLLLAEAPDPATALGALRAGATECLCVETALDALSAHVENVLRRHARDRMVRWNHQLRLFEAVGTAIGGVKHEINNPLAIISGNAQLLLELARAVDLDDELVKPIFDIEEASRRIADSVEQLSSLRALLSGLPYGGDGVA